jgi:hypothetical protein
MAERPGNAARPGEVRRSPCPRRCSRLCATGSPARPAYRSAVQQLSARHLWPACAHCSSGPGAHRRVCGDIGAGPNLGPCRRVAERRESTSIINARSWVLPRPHAHSHAQPLSRHNARTRARSRTHTRAHARALRRPSSDPNPDPRRQAHSSSVRWAAGSGGTGWGRPKRTQTRTTHKHVHALAPHAVTTDPAT